MEKQKQSSFKFLRYLVERAEIKLPNRYIEEDEFEIRIIPSGICSGNRFDLLLEVIVSNTDNSFSAEIDIIGYFQFKPGCTVIDNFLVLNAPAILFPYVRAFISTLTAISGGATIIPPTLNLTSLAEELKKNIKIEDSK
ncbi:MAG: protein-export chaperone SecB [Bacteroidales bacterium]|jgi:preprotein translocase subunit SecB|nr:protein-export chaperone SecB [Bacteroidales bacterium]